ncbi:MAG: Uncharacterised protein [Pseudidiomarina mangrovi]|nr:MAG: Uncharacterised protein [Pseudidiomarina mangrovi]
MESILDWYSTSRCLTISNSFLERADTESCDPEFNKRPLLSVTVTRSGSIVSTAEATMSTMASTSSLFKIEPRRIVITTVALPRDCLRAKTFSRGIASKIFAFDTLVMSSIIRAICCSRACFNLSFSTRCLTRNPMSCMMMSVPESASWLKPCRARLSWMVRY